MRSPFLLCVLVAALAAGCQRPIQSESPTAALVDVPDREQLDFLWDTCLRVLRRYGLQPDRQDRRAGVITTGPVTVPNWFELWRPDMPRGFQFAEANLSTIRRVACIKLEPLEAANDYRLTTEVNLQRHSTPERQVSTAAGAIQMFSAKLPIYTGEMIDEEQAVRWIQLGRDVRFEQALLTSILSYYGGGTYAYFEPELVPPASSQPHGPYASPPP